MTVLSYKGYTGTAVINFEARVLYGQVEGLRDVITYESESVEGLIKEFQASVDDYLAFCADLKEAPEQPQQGKTLKRAKPSVATYRPNGRRGTKKTKITR